ncbi:AIPR family protein [Bremerella sp. JC817]|uniref:AIPR family protein n=1 Tax=Bremerella sp. JC817 TaxID=3231756 RepID=UPI00345872F0
MAKNDALLLDGILDDRVAGRVPSDRRDEAFEYFAFEQLLRDADLSDDEIKAGSVDGRNDGGIDGFFILVNGHPLIDVDSFVWPRSGCELEVWIITCKHHDTFLQQPLDNLAASVNELLDLGLSNEELKGAYSEQLLIKRTHLRLAYRKVSPRLQQFRISFVYASRGDTTQVGDSISARADQIRSTANELFGNCEASFVFAGARELLDTYRKVRTFSIELPFLEALTRGERYIILCTLSDYYEFVIDEEKKLRRYLFDSNVRAFMGLNRVNEDIRDTLNIPDSPDFWWLNNGVTILANSASVTGKSIQLEGVQIVNGLQTTESIYRHFRNGGDDPSGRAVLVKVVVSTDPAVRDSIIRATNNQTSVELSSLHATDKIQRDIEDVLLQHGIFYERRTNYYKNQGRAASELVTPMYLAAGFVSLILKSPTTATTLRTKFMRSDDSYERIFSANKPLLVWPSVVKIMRRTDEVLEGLRPHGRPSNSRFLKNWRHITAFVATSRVLGTFAFNETQLSKIDHDAFTNELFDTSWSVISSHAGDKLTGRYANKRAHVIAICQDVAEKYSIDAIQAVERKTVFAEAPRKRRPLTAEFIAKVDAALPEQPWPPGIHRIVANILGCSPSEAYDATQQLIDEGKRHSQKDGVVYSQDGTVIAVDESRIATE